MQILLERKRKEKKKKKQKKNRVGNKRSIIIRIFVLMSQNCQKFQKIPETAIKVKKKSEQL